MICCELYCQPFLTGVTCLQWKYKWIIHMYLFQNIEGKVKEIKDFFFQQKSVILQEQFGNPNTFLCIAQIKRFLLC